MNSPQAPRTRWQSLCGIALSFLSLLISPAHALDKNGDGMSDVWQRFYNIALPNLDPDGDGRSNLQEAQAGTNPNDPDDYFYNLIRSANDSTATLSWRSVEQRSYLIEKSSDLKTYADEQFNLARPSGK